MHVLLANKPFWIHIFQNTPYVL